MIEIRFHGRGGQGAVVASKIIAEAAFYEGKDIQAFPYFGVERRGAPVTAFTRIDDRPIRIKSEIYTPDYVIILDPSLIGNIDMTYGLKEGGLVLVNIDKPPGDVQLDVDARIATVDARTIALNHGLGSRTAPIVNTALVGAFSKASNEVQIDNVLKAVKNNVPLKKEENAQAAKDAYEKVVI